MTAAEQLSDFGPRLRAFAEVVVRVGLNLQRGQRLLIAEPYELQGVDRGATVIVEAVRAAARAAGCPHPAGIEVIWGDGPQLRESAAKSDWRGFTRAVAANTKKMEECLRHGDALLFLQGSQPDLMAGMPTNRVAELRRIGWEHFGRIAGQLVAGGTNWTVAPAPTHAWAQAVYADLPTDQQLAALWETVFAACRIRPALAAGPLPGPPSSDRPADDPIATWHTHLLALQNRRDKLNSLRLTTLRYAGDGTDFTLTLPPEHVWCTAQLTSHSGVAFVANLPTEEVFTTPHKDSAAGTVRVARPINYGGAMIDGIELEFRQGRVVRASARSGHDLLNRLLDTDDGAVRLGEVALVPHATTLASSGRLFHHSLLDENASDHIALGEAYDFCLRSPNPRATNRSLIHVDLSLDALVSSPGTDLS